MNLKEQQEGVRHALGFLMHQRLAAAWNKWRDTAETDRLDRELVYAALMALMERQLKRAFSKWRETAKLLRMQHELLHRALRALMKQALHRAWNKWRQDYMNLKEQQEIVRHALGFLMHQRLAAAWMTWRANCAAAGFIRQLIVRWQLVSQSKAWHSWRDATASRRVELKNYSMSEKLVMRFVLQKSDGFYSSCFQKWRNGALQKSFVNKQKAKLVTMRNTVLAGLEAFKPAAVDDSKLAATEGQDFQARTSSMAQTLEALQELQTNRTAPCDYIY